MTVAALLIVGVSLVSASTVEFRSAINQSHSTQAFYVAEAGLNWARREVMRGDIILPASTVTPKVVYSSPAFGGMSDDLEEIGELHITVSRTAAGWDLISTGAQHQARRTLSWQITEQLGAGGGSALDRHRVRQAIALSGSSSITGNVTAARVDLTGNPRITGNVEIVGTTLAGQVTGPQGSITGTTTLIPTAQTFNAPAMPPMPNPPLVWHRDFTAGWWPTPPYTLPGTGQYGTITVESELIINVPSAANVVIHVGELIVQGSGRITIARTGTGRVTFLVDRALTINGSGSINNGGSPDAVDVFYFGSTPIALAGSTLLVGSLIAQSADVGITGSGGITGHIITGGSNISVTGNAAAHVRVLYAPNADLVLSGSGRLSGIAIVRSKTGTGNTSLQFDSRLQSQFDRFATDLGLWAPTRTYTFENWRVHR